MGEWSKKVGEVGEDVAALFLQMIGWEFRSFGHWRPLRNSHAACAQMAMHTASRTKFTTLLKFFSRPWNRYDALEGVHVQ